MKILQNNKAIFYLGCAYLLIFGVMFPAIPNLINVAIMAAFCLLLLLSDKEAYKDIVLVALFAAPVGFALTDWHRIVIPDNLEHPYNFKPVNLIFILVWPMSYLLGKYLVGKDSNKADKRLSIVGAALAVGLFIQGVLNYCNHNDGLEATESWDGWNEFWDKTFMSRTVYTYEFLLMAAALFLAIVLFKKNKKLSLAIIAANIATVVMDMFMARGRLQLVMQVLVTFIMLFILIFKDKEAVPAKYKRWFRNVVIAGILIFIAFTIMVSANIAGLGDYYHNSFLGRDGGILRNVRFQSIYEGIKLSIMQPHGGWNTESLGIAHNTFLLFAKEYDSIVLAILLVFEIVIIIRAIRLIKGKTSTAEYFAFSMLITLLLYYNIETAPWRYKYFWVPLLVVSGMISQKLANKTRNK